MKSLVNHIPRDERLVTIEDARELFITQPNVVHLLYSKGSQSTSNVTAKSCMEACLRMKPDRIILAELRGDESFYFIRNGSGHRVDHQLPCRSTAQTWDQLALMVKASAEGSGLEFSVIKRLLMMTIDIVVHMKAHAANGISPASTTTHCECTPDAPSPESGVPGMVRRRAGVGRAARDFLCFLRLIDGRR